MSVRWERDAEERLGPDARKRGLAVRAFFAIALEGTLREAVAARARELAARPGGDGVRWVEADRYHLTLRFLGNVPSCDVDALTLRAHDALAGTAPFSLTLDAPVGFPTPRRPKVIALPAQPADALAGLAARLEKAAVESGLAPEERAFRPHLTLGRVRARRFPDLRAEALEGAQRVSDVVLFRSDLAADGAHYSPLATLALGASAEPASPR